MKTLLIFETDRDIAKIRMVLNSQFHGQLAVKILQKSGNFLYWCQKGNKHFNHTVLTV